MTVSLPTPDRKQRFRAALALLGQTQEQFAESYGVTPSHLSRVVNGGRDSGSLDRAIDDFIARTLPSH